MALDKSIVVGIDVGGQSKGFHAVALRGNTFDRTSNHDPAVIFDWCLAQKAAVLAVDAPCKWSNAGSSRQAERDLQLFGRKLHFFATPKREIAVEHKKGFYGWVFNGEQLYQQLRRHYQLYEGERSEEPLCIESFPHAVACALAGEVLPAKHKASMRRKVLQDRGYDVSSLPNIDYVDAALCAVAADKFRRNSFQCFGNRGEGYSIVPA